MRIVAWRRKVAANGQRIESGCWSRFKRFADGGVAILMIMVLSESSESGSVTLKFWKCEFVIVTCDSRFL